jgi:hypothetical protein
VDGIEDAKKHGPCKKVGDRWGVRHHKDPNIILACCPGKDIQGVQPVLHPQCRAANQAAMRKADAPMERIEPRRRSQSDPVLSPHERDRRAAMTALISAAVLGLVPLPSMASPEAYSRHGDRWQTSDDPAQAFFERKATREEPARRHEHETMKADVTRQ